MMQSKGLILLNSIKLKDQIQDHYYNMSIIFNTYVALINLIVTRRMNKQKDIYYLSDRKNKLRNLVSIIST